MADALDGELEGLGPELVSRRSLCSAGVCAAVRLAAVLVALVTLVTLIARRRPCSGRSATA